MMKWIKNTYYLWLNRKLLTKIMKLTMKLTDGKISKLAYNLHAEKYRDDISKNQQYIKL